MKNFVCVLAAIAIAMIATPAFAQCNSANGQCGAPNGLSLNAQNSLAFLQQQSATTSASSSVAAPAAPAFAAPQLGYQMHAAPAYAYGATAMVMHPSQIYFMLPPANPTVPALDPEGVALTPPAMPVQSYYSLIGLSAPVAASAGGASAAASAASAAPAAAVAPIPVNPGLAAAASSGCANGSCSARRGLFSGGLLGRRSSSRSVSISRSRSR